MAPLTPAFAFVACRLGRRRPGAGETLWRLTTGFRRHRQGPGGATADVQTVARLMHKRVTPLAWARGVVRFTAGFRAASHTGGRFPPPIRGRNGASNPQGAHA